VSISNDGAYLQFTNVLPPEKFNVKIIAKSVKNGMVNTTQTITLTLNVTNVSSASINVSCDKENINVIFNQSQNDLATFSCTDELGNPIDSHDIV